MIYIIVYDISDDKCRNNISKFLEKRAQRVQESVFECRMAPEYIPELTENLKNMIDEQGDIRIYPVCEECYKKALVIGEETEIIGKKGYAVF